MSSTVIAIFDLFGLIRPIVVVYKIFLQQPWLHILDWQGQLLSEYLNHWINIHSRRSHANERTVDRLVLTKRQPTKI